VPEPNTVRESNKPPELNMVLEPNKVQEPDKVQELTVSLGMCKEPNIQVREERQLLERLVSSKRTLYFLLLAWT